MRPLNLFSICLCFILLFATACDRSVVFEKNQKLHENEWHYLDLKTFEFEIVNTDIPYDIYLNIRNTTDYRYSNLYLFLNTVFPNNEVAKDTIEIVLANERGEWLGDGWGKHRFNKIHLGKKVVFGMKGTYIFELEQAMRTDILKDISDIGIRVEKSRSE